MGVNVEVLRVFNNNVVLARDNGGREVVSGRGVGFQAKAGGIVDESKIVRRFVPADEVNPTGFAALVAEIPPEHLALADDALKVAQGRLRDIGGSALFIAIADHLSFAIKRRRQGIEIGYPLLVEVAHLYPDELDTAQDMLAEVNKKLGPDEQLPSEEIVALAMHLVNAGFASGNLAPTYKMTEVLKQVFDVVEQSLGRQFDRQSVNAARFVAHLRYFFVRVHDRRQLDEGHVGVQQAIAEANPMAYQVARHLQAMLELRLDQPVTEDEVTYLTMHVARLSSDSARS